MIKLYTTHCPKCKVVELKLKQLGVSFTEIDDVDTVVKVGQEQGILSAPILEVDEKFYDFTNAIRYLKEVK